MKIRKNILITYLNYYISVFGMCLCVCVWIFYWSHMAIVAFSPQDQDSSLLLRKGFSFAKSKCINIPIALLLFPACQLPYQGPGKDKTSHKGRPSKLVGLAEARDLHKDSCQWDTKLCSRKKHGSKMRDENGTDELIGKAEIESQM